MALAAVAMFILSGTLARTRHARLWAWSFAIYSMEWGLIAVSDGNATRPSWMSVLIGLCALTALIFYYAGFQQRSRKKMPARLAALVVPVALVQLTFLFPARIGPGVILTEGFFPLLRMVLFGLAAFIVAPDRRHASATEKSIIAMLVSVAVANGALLTVVVLEYVHRIPAGSFVGSMGLLGTPVAAAMGLFTLMLIASDFSRERLRLIHTDPLTGVLNRPGFEYYARRAIGRAKPPVRPVSMVLADIDRFKTINDRFGHLTGDAALVSFARHVSDGLPPSALVGRFGGEEFALMLEAQDGPTTLAQVEAIRLSLPQMRVPGSVSMDLTASFGVAEQMPRELLSGLYARADAALYRAKEGGRDRSALDRAP